MHKTDP